MRNEFGLCSALNEWGGSVATFALLIVGFAACNNAGETPRALESRSANPLEVDEGCFVSVGGDRGVTAMDAFAKARNLEVIPDVNTLPAPLIDRDAYSLGAAFNEAIGAQQIIELAKVYPRVCLNDKEVWGRGQIMGLRLYFGGPGNPHQADLAYLHRIFIGYMGRYANEIPKNIGDVDIFVIAPDPRWVGDPLKPDFTDTVAQNIHGLLGPASYAYVLTEDENYTTQGTGRLAQDLLRFPMLDHRALSRGPTTGFPPNVPLWVRWSRQGPINIPVSSVYLLPGHYPREGVVVELTHKRAADACP